jgi:hypothetical protein
MHNGNEDKERGCGNVVVFMAFMFCVVFLNLG